MNVTTSLSTGERPSAIARIASHINTIVGLLGNIPHSFSVWRNRAEFLSGRDAIVQFLIRKWNCELDYRLVKELWTFHDNRIAVRFAYEWHDDSGSWFRSYGNENWEFDASGLMRRRFASINDLPLRPDQRKLHWPSGRRPDDHPELSELAL